jgi:xanthosine utilization system XapX-like protein
MPTFTVHQPPPKKGETESAPERFVFVRDGFHFWAFVVAPLWLLVHRLWLALIGYLILNVAFAFVLTRINAPPSVKLVTGFLISLLVGMEAATFWRWSLRKWKMLGFVVAEDTEMAERRFFAEWSKRVDAPLPAPSPKYATPIWRGAPSPSDVIGLFPEPGQQR